MMTGGCFKSVDQRVYLLQSYRDRELLRVYGTISASCSLLTKATT